MKLSVAYGVSLAAVVVAVVVRLLLEPLLADRIPFVTLFAAVVFIARYCGRGPALLALVVGSFAVVYFILYPRYSFAIDQPEYQVGLILYGGVGIAAIALLDSLEKARRRLEEKRTRLEQEVADRQAAERVVAELGERLRTTLASIGDAVIATDREGRITTMNAVAESLTGWKIGEATGQPLDAIFRIVNEETRQPVGNPALRALKEGIIVGLANHTVLIAKGGTERAIDDSAAPIRCRQGEVVGCVLVFRDITERRRLEKQNADRLAAARFLASIIESSEDAIISKSLDGIIQSWNAAAERLFGYSAAQAVGRHVSFVIPPERADEEELILARIRAGKSVEHFDTVRVRHDGQPVHVSLTISPIKDEAGRIVGASKIIRDITERHEAERQLAESEARKTAILDTALDCIITCDHEGKILEFNPAAERTFGYRREDVIGREMSAVVVPPSLRQRHRIGMARFMKTRQSRILGKRLEMMGLRADGTEFPVEFSVTEIPTDGLPLFTAYLRDITDRKQAEEKLRESEQRLRFIMDSMPQKIFTAKPNGDVDYFNPVWTEFTGLSFEQIEDWGWTQFIHPDDVAENVRAWKHAVATGEEFVFEHRFRRADGQYRWHISRALPMRDGAGHVIMWIGSNTDIHDAKEADRRKDEFLATLAHELRNLLAPVRNAVQVLQIKGPALPELQWARDVIDRQMQGMTRLIDDLLDVSRITRNKLELRRERTELAQVVQGAVETSRPLIEECGHELTVTLPPEPIPLNADVTRLAQVFLNLLNNAAKYTERGGRIDLTAERQGSDVVVSVKDTGIGIPVANLPTIFEMFAQVDGALSRSQGGLGIGLCLVKRLVEMHGGTIEAKSEGPGKGSEFVVRLPLWKDEGGRMKDESATDRVHPSSFIPHPSKLRVLVVDDNRDAASSLAMFLKIMGNNVRTAYDGEGAVQAAGEFRPQVVLLDIGLPKMNGYDACRRIRQ